MTRFTILEPVITIYPSTYMNCGLRKFGTFQKLLLMLVALVFTLPVYPSAISEYKIGVLAFRGVPATLSQWTNTANYLESEIPDTAFNIVPVDLNEMSDALAASELDFILTNPGNYVVLEERFGISRLSTIRNLRQGIEVTQFGAVIITRADNEEINTIADLKGSTFAAVSEKAFGGFQMAWFELKQAGVDPFKDLSRLEFQGFPQDDLVLGVLAGKYDAATVRSDVLEGLSLEGKIDLSELKILNRQTTENYPFLVSTRLYPEWPFAKAKHTPENIARQVASALLKLQKDHPASTAAGIAGWTIPLDYGSVHDLLKTLNVDPYDEPPEMNFGLVWSRYKIEISLALALLLVLLATTYYISRSNKILAHSRAELAQYRDRLEDKVKLRTRQLEEVNQSLEQSDYSLRQLHDITASAELKFADKLDQLLSLGCALFNADIALILLDDLPYLKYVASKYNPDTSTQSLLDQLPRLVQDLTANRSSIDEVLVVPDLQTPIANADKTGSRGALVLARFMHRFEGVGYLAFFCRSKDEIHLSDVNSDIALLIAQWIGQEMERQQAAAQSAERQKQLAKASRLNTLGTLSASIAHELNQPLTAISNYGSGCIRRLNGTADIDQSLRTAIHMMTDEAKRAGEIMDRLRKVVEPGSPERKPVDLRTSINNVIAITQDSFDQGRVTVTYDHEDWHPIALGDQIQIEQVLVNLIKNAIESMEDHGIPDGTITIHIESAPGSKVRVSVENPGGPIPPDMTNEIFQAFYSSKGDGMGLGLAISRSIVESMGGEILTVPRDEGAVFIFTLPLNDLQNPVATG